MCAVSDLSGGRKYLIGSLIVFVGLQKMEAPLLTSTAVWGSLQPQTVKFSKSCVLKHMDGITVRQSFARSRPEITYDTGFRVRADCIDSTGLQEHNANNPVWPGTAQLPSHLPGI